MNHGHLITVTTVSASDHARHPKENRNPPNSKATMFHKPRLHQKAVCRQSKLRRGCYPQKHTRTSRKHDYTDATRRYHNFSCDRKKEKSSHQKRNGALMPPYTLINKSHHTRSNALFYNIPSKSLLGLLRFLFMQTRTYLQQTNRIYSKSQTSMLNTGKVQLQSRTEATHENMFKTST